MTRNCFLFVASLFSTLVLLGQPKSEVILKKADELYAKNYNASFDLCCQAEKINDIRYIGEVCICKARYYLVFTDYENAEIELAKAVSFYKEKNDLRNLSHVYDLKSILFDRIGDSTASSNYLLKAYKISLDFQDTAAQIKRLTNLSGTLMSYNKLDKANYYLHKLEVLSDHMTSKEKYYLYQNKGSYYNKLGYYDQAIMYYEKAYKLAKKNHMIDSQATILMLLGQGYKKNKKYTEAEKYALLSYTLSEKHKLIYEKSEALIELISIKEILKDYASAFKFQQEYIKVEEEILNSEKLNRISAIQNRLVLAEKENIINRQYNKIAAEKLKNTETELRTQKLYIFISIILVIFVFFVFIYFRTKKLNATIRSQKFEVEEKNKLVESQHKDITDSIRYAERIQQAILPPEEQWISKLPKSFVYYAPKDILSGDFYWIEETVDSLYIAAADCTGHGVPGALISIVNYNLLNKAILEKQLTDPAKILDAVNDWLTESLHQTAKNSTVKDGMDVSLISIHKTTLKLEFSGAFNSIYIYRNSELIEIKGDKFPVGAFIHEERKHFTTQSFQLREKDMIYLFTDGYADQFGGENGKKFKYAKLKDLLREIHIKAPEEQYSIVQSTFINWKGKNEQVDDVLVIGIQI